MSDDNITNDRGDDMDWYEDDPREIGPVTPAPWWHYDPVKGEMHERPCAVHGCTKSPSVRVRFASGDTVFDLELCDDDLVFVREANLGVISGETQL